MWQLTSPFPVTIAEIGTSFSIPKTIPADGLLFIASPIYDNDMDTHLSCRYIQQYSTQSEFPRFSLPGYYDWIVMNDVSHEIVSKGRYIVLPAGTKQNQFYEVLLEYQLYARFLLIMSIFRKQI